ncbi:hypothetical protein KIN20_013789 [Parelaphostrongylus tenuis]|uniref:Uncharacterized protein n=1 Tax=Parelaphostrongylus tenuis TaxID=148309 RepID=A0AAD5ME21_PARTN|nr:hypothetical protein KIN20_013789 [Parelaphostrongylus tenuis]
MDVMLIYAWAARRRTAQQVIHATRFMYYERTEYINGANKYTHGRWFDQTPRARLIRPQIPRGSRSSNFVDEIHKQPVLVVTMNDLEFPRRWVDGGTVRRGSYHKISLVIPFGQHYAFLILYDYCVTLLQLMMHEFIK